MAPVLSRALKLAVVLLPLAVLYVLATRRRATPVGSQTNASDAVDAPELSPDASAEEVLDVAVEYTFPASDPVAVQCAYEVASRRRGG